MRYLYRDGEVKMSAKKLIPKAKDLPKADAGGIAAVAGMAIAGAFTTAMTQRYVGEGDMRAGAVKIGAAYALDKMLPLGVAGRIVSGGLVFSGAMDLTGALGLTGMAGGLGGKLGGAAPQMDDW